VLTRAHAALGAPAQLARPQEALQHFLSSWHEALAHMSRTHQDIPAATEQLKTLRQTFTAHLVPTFAPGGPREHTRPRELPADAATPPPPPPPPPAAAAAAAPAAGKATAAVAPLRPGVAILAAASLYLRNVWIGGGTKTLVQFQPGGHVLASPGGAWVEVGEYARGMWQSSAPDEEHLEKAGGVAFTSGVHVLSGSDLKPLGAASSSNVTTGELIVGVRSSR